MMKFAKITIAAALVWLAGAFGSLAQQSSPGWTYGYVPTPAEWNFWFGKKVDWQGAVPCIVTGCTFTGPVITAPSTTLGAGFNVPPGTAPATPNNGDIWITAAGIFVRINGATVGPLAGATSSGFAGTSPITVSFPSGVVTYACPTCGVTGSPLSQFASTTSAQLAGVISDETGSGLLLFATSPTIGGTWAGSATFSGNITHSGQLIHTGTSAPASAAGNTVVMGTISAPSLANNGQAFLYNTAVNGAVLEGQGSTYDVAIANKSGSVAIGIRTGTTTPSFPSLSSGTCVNGLAVDSSNNLVLVACPGAAASITLGTTTIGGSPSVGNCLSVATGPVLGQLSCARLDLADQVVTGGANVTSLSLTTGNITVDCGARPLQFITNNGAYTITAPANDGSCVLLVTNGATAGATTFSGFTVNSNTGEPLTTTNTSKFTINIVRINGVSTYLVKALQ